MDMETPFKGEVIGIEYGKDRRIMTGKNQVVLWGVFCYTGVCLEKIKKGFKKGLSADWRKENARQDIQKTKYLKYLCSSGCNADDMCAVGDDGSQTGICDGTGRGSCQKWG